MAKIDVIVQVGEFAPETGEYRHSACDVVINLNKNNRIPPCYSKACPNKKQSWTITVDQPE